MKTLIVLLTFLCTHCGLYAGEPIRVPAHIKFIYADPDKKLTEAETTSLLASGDTIIPLVTPQLETWICGVYADIEEMTIRFSVTDAQKLKPEEGGATSPIMLLSVTAPLKSGQEVVLVKNSLYTLSAIITLPPASEKPAEAGAKARSARLWLTDEEMKQLEIVLTPIDSSRGVTFRGHNPFEKRLGGGVLQVTIAASAGKPELKREYQVDCSSEPLADFANNFEMHLPEGSKPEFVMKRIWFAE